MNGPGFIREALDPRHSVVVEACAGSGKTWLLVSRIVRLLLDGAAPGEVLAITYTRKAAREIEERLQEWLRQLAVDDEATVREFLLQRALPEEAVEDALVRARGLYERVLSAQPPLTVSTFHGWYARLLQGAPLSSDLAGFVLHESGARLKDEVWQFFAAERARRNDPATDSLMWLLQNVGLEATRKLLFGLSDRRAEWHAFAGEGEAAAAQALADLRGTLGVGEAPAAVGALLADDLFMRKLRDYAGILRRSDLERDLRTVQILEESFVSHGEERFRLVLTALVTRDGTLRQRKPSKEADRRFGPDAGRLLQLHAWLGERVLATLAARCEEQAYELNEHVFTAGVAWIDALEQYKRERRLMDFSDLEWHVSRLLADEAHAAFLQARLDARYRHILLDEFQDTNPLQWQILLAWLDAYGAAEADRPRVFVVGDPKQSIYRFRRAEPRVFDCAAAYLRDGYAAHMLDNDATRRNAPALVEVVNRIFADAPQFPHFRPHRSLNAALPGRVEILPLCTRESADDAPVPLRNPLVTPQAAAEDGRRRGEAVQLAGRLRRIVGAWAIVDPDSGRARPARYGDIMVLTRRRSVLPEFERALRTAGIPYVSAGRGGLLRTLEAADLTALLRCLVTSADDLSLAHALRTPVLAASDEDLIMLSGRGEPDWWQRLQACVEGRAASPALDRAAGLLAGWRVAAAHLPVHDLLDRIYHEGELVERYRSAVPDALWPGVAANLEAYVALALQLDAGRFPSLPRFLDELARLGEAGDEEAPDEGTIQAAEAGDRVRILTIHGAKGLEAPIVWLIDASNAPLPRDVWSLLIDWPPESARPSHLSVLGRKEDRGTRRADLIEAEAAYAEREELNLLYVALTRARQYFFASGIAAERNRSKASYWDRLAAALAALGADDGVFGEAPALAESASPAATSPLPSSRGPDCPPAGRRREVATAGMDYGTRLHAAIEWLSAGGEASRPPQGIQPGDWPAFRSAARTILDAPHLQPFFDPARYLRARNEAEFVLTDGTVGRIDRLVETSEAIWVLDYKSGRPQVGLMDAYRAQLEAYRAAVGGLYPGRTVRCGLVTGGGEFLEI